VELAVIGDQNLRDELERLSGDPADQVGLKARARGAEAALEPAPRAGGAVATFGRYLLERGALNRVQLEEATQVMVVFGGRLGTILVEAGILTLEQVEEHLARHLDLPCAPRERLGRPDPKALEAVSADLARRCALFPMWIEKRKLHAAMLDAADPNRVDAAAFAMGRSVVPYVIAERRLVQLLEDHYGIRPDSRFTDFRILELAGHVQPRRARSVEGDGEGAAMCAAGRARPEEDDLARWREAHGMLPLGEDEELSDVDSFERLHAGPARGPLPSSAAAPAKGATDQRDGSRLPPARSAGEVAQLEAQLVMTADRDAVVPTALRVAAYYARLAAIFAVRDGMVQGVLAAGDSASPRIDGIYVPTSEPSMLAAAIGGAVFERSPARDGIDGTVVRVIGGGEPLEAAVLPIAIDGRAVQLLYVDNGPDPLAPSSLAALGALCDTISSTYQRLVAEKTRQHC
jgi:hypothetical protein